MKVPKKLGHEPILDAIFEMRFAGGSGAAGVLPGMLFAALKNVESIESLPIAQMPEAFRDMDPNMRYAALNRLHWGKYMIHVGPHSVAVSCKLPYPGWSEFCAAILEVLACLPVAPLVGAIDRCSLKYVNLFEVKGHKEALQTFTFNVALGAEKLSSNNTHLRVEIPRDSFLHAITLITEAKAMHPTGASKSGAILDVDTMALTIKKSLNDFRHDAPTLLKNLHDSNHEMFFSCLSEKTVQALEPQYE